MNEVYTGKHERCPMCGYALNVISSSEPHEPVEVEAIVSGRSKKRYGFSQEEIGEVAAEVWGLHFTCPRCGYWWTEKVPE